MEAVASWRQCPSLCVCECRSDGYVRSCKHRPTLAHGRATRHTSLGSPTTRLIGIRVAHTAWLDGRPRKCAPLSTERPSRTNDDDGDASVWPSLSGKAPTRTDDALPCEWPVSCAAPVAPPHPALACKNTQRRARTPRRLASNTKGQAKVPQLQTPGTAAATRTPELTAALAASRRLADVDELALGQPIAPCQ